MKYEDKVAHWRKLVEGAKKEPPKPEDHEIKQIFYRMVTEIDPWDFNRPKMTLGQSIGLLDKPDITNADKAGALFRAFVAGCGMWCADD